jgi:hypothetical protein
MLRGIFCKQTVVFGQGWRSIAETFEEKLKRVTWAIRPVVFNDQHRRYSDGLLYWSNKAQRLHDAAMLLGGDPFGPHFEAFTLLAGYSLELLMKGTLKGLGEEVPLTYDLLKLSERAGLSVSSNDRAVLQAFTIYTTWYSRYPAAKTAREMEEGLRVLEAQYPRQSGNLRKLANGARTSPSGVNAANYERLYGFFNARFGEVQSCVCQSVELELTNIPK